MNRISLPFTAALLCLLLPGCEWMKPKSQRPNSRLAPFVRTYTKPGVPEPQRVAVLPVECDQAVGETLLDIDEIFLAEAGKKLRFELVPIKRPALSRSIQREQFSSTEPTPPEAVGFLREKYAVDAILFTEITSYRPYRPISVGVRSKLVDASSLATLWTAETVLDAGDPIVAEAAMLYASRQSATSDTRGGEMMLQSPRRYLGFVASHLYFSLPKFWATPSPATTPVLSPATPTPQAAPQNPVAQPPTKTGAQPVKPAAPVKKRTDPGGK